MKKALVTGADGFIGSHLAESLVEAGVEVRALVFYNSFDSRGWLEATPSHLMDSIEVVAGDIRDPSAMRSLVADCDTVFHLAALIAIPFSYRAPSLYVDTNVGGTLNLLEAARDKGVERFVHTSTSEVYGTAQEVPITESHPLQAQSPYAASKIAADQLALSYYASFDLPVTVVRPFNTYGPRQSARAVIPTIAGQIAAGQRTISLGSLHPTRDFSFVRDTADGFISAARCEALLGEVVNLGSGFEISIGETAALIAEVMDADVEVVSDEERIRPRKSEVERLFAGTDKAKTLFGWNPSFSGRDGFRRGLGETVKWFSDPSNLNRYRHDQYVI